MDATPTYAFPFPELSDAPNVPSHFSQLATAVEAKFATNDTNLPRGIKAVKRSNLNSNSTPVTAETMQLSVTFTAEANRTYRVLFSGGTVDSAGPTLAAAIIVMRWAQGASVTTAGTAIGRTQTSTPASGSANEDGSSVPIEGFITGATAGSVTVGVSIASTTAVAVGFFSTSVSGLCLSVEDVGPTIVPTSAALP